MARLALVAMLLLATLPTFGRLLGASGDAAHESTQSAWTAMCTAAGLEHAALPVTRDPAAAVDQGGTPAAPHHGDDCAYCPLLASVVFALATLALVLPQHLPSCLCTWHRVAARAIPHPCGLGSRGPPVAL